MINRKELWNEYKEKLRNYIAKRVSNNEEREDILQNIFLKIYEGVDKIKDEQKITSWVFTVAKNTIIDFYRKKTDSTTFEEEIFVLKNEENTIYSELSECLVKQISDLDDGYRIALQYSDLYGMKQKDVAEKLGIKVSSAKSRIQRGREKLKEKLLECCYIELSENGIISYTPKKNNIC